MSHVRVKNTSGRRLNARRPKHPRELRRMGIRVVKEVARGVARVEPSTPRGAHQRPLLLPVLPMRTPRNAHKGITLPLKGLTPRGGDWPGRYTVQEGVTCQAEWPRNSNHKGGAVVR